jgi:hypothetical protein
MRLYRARAVQTDSAFADFQARLPPFPGTLSPVKKLVSSLPAARVCCAVPSRSRTDCTHDIESRLDGGSCFGGVFLQQSSFQASAGCCNVLRDCIEIPLGVHLRRPTHFALRAPLLPVTCCMRGRTWRLPFGGRRRTHTLANASARRIAFQRDRTFGVLGWAIFNREPASYETITSAHVKRQSRR